MSYDTNMTGTISKNDRKEKDTHPDIRGKCEIDGVTYWIDGWQKTRQSDGSKFYSLRFKAKDAAPAPAPKAAKPAAPDGGGGFEDMDDDIPFIDPMKRLAFALAV